MAQPPIQHTTPAGVSTPAREHYRRGNRLYRERAWELALLEWRQALRLWRPAAGARRSAAFSLAGLRAVLALLATVLALYWVLFTFFPRDPAELFPISAGFGEPRGWWERFLDTGRPGSGGDSHKLGVREWWQRFRDRVGWGETDALGRDSGFRPNIDQRWAELLRRYGRWGPLVPTDVNLNIVSGYGLTVLGDYEQAVKLLKKAVAQTEDRDELGEIYQTLASAYYFQGYILQKDQLASYDLNLVRLSAEAYEQAVRYRPQVVAYGNLGWAYFLLGDYKLAEQYSLRALRFDESLAYVRLNLGLIYLVRGEARKAFNAYRDVVIRLPEDEVYLGGITDLKEVLRDHPGRHPFAHLMVGYLSLHRGDLPEARRHFQAYLARPGGDPDWRERAQQWLRDPASALE